MLSDRQTPIEGRPDATPASPKRRGLGRLGLLRPARSRLLLNALTLVVTVVFSYIALSGIHLSAMWRALRTSDYWWLLPTLATFALATAARALRWRALFAPERRPPLGAVANAMLVGYLYNNILPARAGEAARVLVLTQRSEAPPVEIVGTVVLERLYDVLAILVIFFVAEPWLPHVSWFGAAAIVAVALALAIAATATVLVVYGDRPLRFLLRPLGRLPLFSGERLDHTLAELVHGLSGLRHRGVALSAFMWTTLAWMLSALSAWLLTHAFPLHLPFASGVLLMVAIGLGMILPAPPAAVGVFEGAALIALRAYGIAHSAALPYALVLHLTNIVPFVLAGALVVQHNARHPRRRRPGDRPAPTP
jgi:glycosyltransferase 2 family protein